MPRMTNEEALDILERKIECDNDNCPEPGMSCIECQYNVDAIDYARARKMAIEALSEQCASCKQANESVIVNFVAFQRKWLKTHKIMELNSADEVMTEIFLKETGKAFIYSLGQSAENDEDRTRDDEGPKLFGKRTIIEPGEEFIAEDLLKEALDQSADSDKMIKLEKRTITERLIIAESLINSVIADSNQFREATKKTDFKPGDKFILELGQERRMFGEFEIKGTDLYVRTDLLEKLTRYEPGENPGNLGENPGIIRCNACKYWIQTVGRMQGYGLGKCDFHDANLVNCNGFCYWAERRNDG